MDKLTNTSINKIIDASLKAQTGPAWLEDNEKLIEKLEMAYRTAPDQKNEIDDKQFYGIKLGTFNLLINNHTHSELHEENTVHPIPLVAEWILGVTNIRGDIIPVIDLEKIITGKSLGHKPNQNKIIIINKGKDAIGLLINQLPTLMNFDDDDIHKDLSSIPKTIHEYVEHIYTKNQEAWVCIDFPSFIQSITR